MYVLFRENIFLTTCYLNYWIKLIKNIPNKLYRKRDDAALLSTANSVGEMTKKTDD